MLIAGGMQAVGSIVQGEGQAASLNQQARAAEYNARAADIQARQAFDAGTQNELSQRREQARRQGQIRASAAESGFVSSSGSALLAQGQSARDMELDALSTRYQGLLQGNTYEQQATMDRYTADTLRSSAKGARLGGYMSAATSLLSGAAYGADKGLFKFGNTNKVNLRGLRVAGLSRAGV